MPPTPTPAIEVTSLTKTYGRHDAVRDLTFSVPVGRVTGCLGPNGAGKTTTLRMILGLVRPTAGTATVAGMPFAALPDPARTVGVLIEGARTHPGRTALDHLGILARERSVDRARVAVALERVQLGDVGDRRVGEFSLGMRQRLDLAAALLGDPEILILDEPANGLDPAGIRWLREFLRAFADDGGTVFVSSHQLAETAQLADDVVVIDRGRLVAHTAVRELTAERVVRVRSPRIGVLAEHVRAGGGVVHGDGTDAARVTGLAIETVGRIAGRACIELHELSERTRTLEDVFLDLTDDHRDASHEVRS